MRSESGAGYSAVSSVSTTASSWARDIHRHDDMATSMWVAPSPSVVASSSRYHDSDAIRPSEVEHGLDLPVAKRLSVSADAGIWPDR